MPKSRASGLGHASLVHNQMNPSQSKDFSKPVRHATIAISSLVRGVEEHKINDAASDNQSHLTMRSDQRGTCSQLSSVPASLSGAVPEFSPGFAGGSGVSLGMGQGRGQAGSGASPGIGPSLGPAKALQKTKRVHGIQSTTGARSVK